MTTPPVFTTGQVLTAAQMNAVGLWLVKSQTVGSGVSSVTITDAFSADYDNYRIVWEGIIGSTSANFTFQFSGITGSVYSAAGTFFNYGSATVNGYGPAASTSWLPGPISTAISAGFLDLTAPNIARRKTFFTQGSTQAAYYSFGGVCDSTSTATGFVLGTNSGTMTGGTIRVYGYRN